MPRKRLEFHKLSNRSKRRRINEDTDSLLKSDSSSSKNCSSNNINDYNEENYDFQNDNSDCSYKSKQSTTTSKNIIEDTNEIQDNVEVVKSFMSPSSSDETNILFHSDFDSSPLCAVNSTLIYNEEETSTDIKTFLRTWAIKYNITYASLSALLVGLKGNVESLLEVLPSDARSL